jgi:hypothetical protein
LGGFLGGLLHFNAAAIKKSGDLSLLLGIGGPCHVGEVGVIGKVGIRDFEIDGAVSKLGFDFAAGDEGQPGARIDAGDPRFGSLGNAMKDEEEAGRGFVIEGSRGRGNGGRLKPKRRWRGSDGERRGGGDRRRKGRGRGWGGGEVLFELGLGPVDRRGGGAGSVAPPSEEEVVFEDSKDDEDCQEKQGQLADHKIPMSDVTYRMSWESSWMVMNGGMC